jgi:hypothetical protein
MVYYHCGLTVQPLSSDNLLQYSSQVLLINVFDVLAQKSNFNFLNFWIPEVPHIQVNTGPGGRMSPIRNEKYLLGCDLGESLVNNITDHEIGLDSLER